MASPVLERPLETAPAHEGWPQAIQANASVFTDEEAALVKMLLDEGQSHLFAAWPQPGVKDKEKHRFFEQVTRLDESYPGGLRAYIRNARELLAASKEGRNPFQGWTPSVPSGETLNYGDEAFMSFEETGLAQARNAAFVLVAGGLGERLGYSGIKVALPTNLVTNVCFLQLYIENILALQEASHQAAGGSGQPCLIPLVIMTSDDTHLRTQQLLEKENFFGMDPSQITLLKQEKVACLEDNDAHIALDPSDPFAIQTKPHGHGDVHSLLFSSGLLAKWAEAGLKWVLFFQDTNGLLFKAIPASLGVSATRDYEVNSLAVPRKAKEAIGAITRLKHEDGREIIINVEYNQLDPLLRATGHPDGDVNDATGYSPYPGNINQLVLKLEPYLAELSRTKGQITEFVNPKYKDASRTAFKSSTRLECMMQDYPKTLSPTAKVGFTVMDVWLGYSPVKNNAADAAAKLAAGTPPHSASSGEMAIYQANCIILRKAGVAVADPKVETYNNQPVEVWPRVVWSPRWALTFAQVKAKVGSEGCEISQRSVLVLDGSDISLSSLKLDGTLLVRAAPGAKVQVSGLAVENKGWKFEPLDSNNVEEPEELRIRGYKLIKEDERVLDYPGAGNYTVRE